MSEPSPELVERHREVDLIRGGLGAAAAGDGRLVLVEGPAGIGKTSLLEQAVAEAEAEGMAVFKARGGILEQELEFGVVRQLFERAVLAGDGGRLRGPSRAAAPVFGLGELPRDPGPGRDLSANLLHGLYWLVVDLAEERPALIVIDDAHWSDRSSMMAAAFLARRIEGLPVAMLIGSRTDEPGARLEELAAVAQELNAPAARPGPLSREGVAAVLTANLGRELDPELVEAAAAASRGNPFFLTELARDLGEVDPEELDAQRVHAAGPLAVRRSMLMRLGALGDEARRLVWAVAVLGGEGDIRHAAAIAGLPMEAAREAADVLAGAGILEVDPLLRVAHPLVRAAIIEDVPESKKAEAHRRALEVLREAGAPDDVLSSHALNAEPASDPELVELLRRTANRALLTGSPRTAVVHLERAVAEPPPPADRPEVTAELGRAEVRSAEYAGGIAHLDQALRSGLAGPARRGIQRDRAFAAFAAGGMDGAREFVVGALGEIDDPGSDEAIQLEADLALLAWLSGSESGVDVRRHLGVEGRTEAERTMLALLSQEMHATGSHPDEVVELANRAIGGGRLIEEDGSDALSWYMATYSLLTCEAFDDARATIEQALADGSRRGSAFGVAGPLGCRAVLHVNEGRPAAAEADARTAASGPVPPIMVPVNASFAVRALVEQGKLAEAERTMIEAGIADGGGPTVLRWIPWARAVLHEAQGNVEAVRADVQSLREDDESRRSMKALSWRALLARAISRSGYSEEAEALAEEHLRWATWWDRPGALGIARRAAALAGPADARIERLHEAVATLETSGYRTEEARARVELGVACLRKGLRREGTAELERALEVAMACGARIPAQTAADELRIAGAAPRRLSFDELTASERRVAEHAAAGNTNREIAEILFVTPKTVENHLTRVYTKLGISSRRELSGAL